jgi:hypothetical protein
MDGCPWCACAHGMRKWKNSTAQTLCFGLCKLVKQPRVFRSPSCISMEVGGPPTRAYVATLAVGGTITELSSRASVSEAMGEGAGYNNETTRDTRLRTRHPTRGHGNTDERTKRHVSFRHSPVVRISNVSHTLDMRAGHPHCTHVIPIMQHISCISTFDV